MQFLEDYRKAQYQFHNTRPPEDHLPWLPPPVGVYKINVDTSVRAHQQGAGLVVIIRDWRGHTMAWQRKRSSSGQVGFAVSQKFGLEQSDSGRRLSKCFKSTQAACPFFYFCWWYH